MANWDPMAEHYNVSSTSYYQDSREKFQLDKKSSNSTSPPTMAIALYVSGLPTSFDSDALKNLFSPYGKVLRSYCSDEHKVHRNKIGFVNFGTMKEAEEAISRVNNTMIECNEIRVSLSRSTVQKLNGNNGDMEDTSNYKSPPNRGTNDSFNSSESGNQSFKSVELTDNSLRIKVNNAHSEKMPQNERGVNLRGTFQKRIDNHNQQERVSNMENDHATALGLHLGHLIHGNYAREIPEVEATPESCEICGNLAFFRCAQCKCTWYCCQACQYDDWSDHKKSCVRLPIEDNVNVIKLSDLLYPNQNVTRKTSPQPPKQSNTNLSSNLHSNQARNFQTMPKKESPNGLNGSSVNRKGVFNHNAFQEPPDVVEPLRKPNLLPIEVQNTRPKETPKPVRTTLPKQYILKEKDAVAPIFGSNPWDFYVQRFADSDAIDLISKRLKTGPLVSNTQSFNVGSLCAAMFSDRIWYRGKIEKVEDGQYLVYFVDYGNRETVAASNLKLLPNELYDYHEMAFHSKLFKVKPPWDSLDFSEELLKKFQDVMASSNTFFVKECYQRGSLFEISLLDEEGREISDFLVEKPNKKRISLSPIIPDQSPPRVTSSVKPRVKENSPSLGSVAAVATPSKITWDFPPTVLKSSGFKVGDEATLVVVFKPESKTEIYCWLFHEEYLLALQDIEGKLRLLLDKDLPRPKIGELIAAEANDTAWYRAVVKEVDDTKLRVMFVDYGNEEEIKNFKKLPLENSLVPSCLLLVRDEQNGQFINQIELNSSINVKIIAYAENEILIEWDDQGLTRRLRCYPWFNNLPKTLPPVENVAVKQAAAVKPVVSSPQITENTSSSYIPSFNDNAKLPTYNLTVDGNNNRVSVVWVKYPNQIYLQKETEQDKIASLMNSIAVYCGKLQNKPNKIIPKVGTYVCVRFSDNIWYRGLVIGHGETPDEAKVLLVDYGNETLVSAEEILPLPRDAYDYHPFAYLVTLDDVENIDTDSGKLLVSKNWRLKITSKRVLSNKCFIKVRLYDGEVCINDNLKELRQPTPPVREDFVFETINSEHLENLQQVVFADNIPKATLEIGDEATLRVTNIISLNYFFCSNENPSNVEEFEHLHQEIHRYGEKTKADPNFKPIKGQAVLVKNSDDDLWHRAVILETFPDEKESSLFFMDDGKFDKISDSKLLSMPALFAVAPSRCIIAALYGVVEKDDWDVEIERQFKSIIKRDDYLIKCEIKGYDEDNDTYHVKIPSMIEFLQSRDLL